jgi:hypothetical protein
MSANAHRRHLTREQKRDAIAALLKLDPERSDRQIGKDLGADHKTVGAVRAKAEVTGEIPHSPERRGADGRITKATKVPPVEEPSAPEEEPEEVLGQVEETATSGQVAAPEASPAPEPDEDEDEDEDEVEPEQPDGFSWELGNYTLRLRADGWASLGKFHPDKGVIAVTLYCAECDRRDKGFPIYCEPDALAGGLDYVEWSYQTLGWTLTDGRLLCPDHRPEDDE